MDDGHALSLFKSYLEGMTQRVSIEGVLSDFSDLQYGVPQGSVLGPIEFCIYTIPLGAILRHYNINYHIYADDTQLYCTFDAESLNEVRCLLHSCLSDIRSWMIKNKLKINDDKTEFLVITSPYSKLSNEIRITIGQTEIVPESPCKSLGVMFDSRVCMDAQIKHICRSTLFHIRNIRAIRDLLPSAAAAQLIHSLISSRLDYCNSLLYGLPDYRIKRLQRIQNIAARVVALCPKWDHITPVLKSLHWLPIKTRITYKILLLTFKCINKLAPAYLCDLVTPYKQSRALRSNSRNLIEIPETRTKSYGNRSFSYAAAVEWNKLSLDIKQSPNIDIFKKKLKTHLFQQCYA